MFWQLTKGDAAPLIAQFQDAARAMITRGADVIIPGEAPLCLLLARHAVTEVDGVPILVCGDGNHQGRRDDGRDAPGDWCGTVSPRLFPQPAPRARLKELLGFYGISHIGQK